MPPPSQLSISTSSLQRLVKEEGSYYKELEKQEARLLKTQNNEDGDENADYKLKQEKAAIEETRAVFPPLRQRIADALRKLEDQLEAGQENGTATEAEVAKAKDVIESAKKATSDVK